ncbi:ABC transporter, ATP-binding protein, partial [Opisthorchis viverrini]
SAKGSTVSFHDVSYEVSVRKFPWSCPVHLPVLSNLNGIILPGMNAIMGPTGCGKSSLLDVLAGRKNPQQLSGYVLLDGERPRANVHRHLCGYVVQDNIAVDTLTVRENIAFSAALRLPRKLTSEERKAKVDEVIEELGLTSVADRLLGTAYVRGVSGGERKRTCIGIELVKNPLVLYLDEPTTGLDAYTAGSVMKTLRRLADCGRTIVFSIHQPKYSIYRLFDRLTLLCNGKMVYHGPSGQVPIQYFRRLGYVIEGYNNPADFLMDTLHGEVAASSSDEDSRASPHAAMEINSQSPTDLVDRFVDFWIRSELYRRCQAMVTEIARRYEARLLDAHAVDSSTGYTGPNRKTYDRITSAGSHRRGSIESACGPLAVADSASDASSNHFSDLRLNSAADFSSRKFTHPETISDGAVRVAPGLPDKINLSHSRIRTRYVDSVSASGEDRHMLERLQNVSPSATDEEIPKNLGLPSYHRRRHYKRFRCGSGCSVRQDNHPESSVNLRFKDGPYSASFCRQLVLLIRRQCLSMLRDYHSMFSHFLIQFIIAVFFGTIYYDLDKSAESGIQNRTGLFFFTCIQLLFINGSLVDAFLRDRLIFRHETSAGFYRISTYFFAKIITEVLPVKAFPAFLFLPITYILAGLRHTWRAFFFWELTVILLTISASGVAFSVSTMVTDVRLGSMLLSMFFVLMMITGGFLINVLSLAPWLSWLRYLSVLRLAMNVFMINELVGLEFCPSNDTLHHTFSSDTSGFPYNHLNASTAVELTNTSSTTITPISAALPCILGEQYLETQAIEYDGAMAVWRNEIGIFGIFLLALLNGYVYLRMMRKYT